MTAAAKEHLVLGLACSLPGLGGLEELLNKHFSYQSGRNRALISDKTIESKLESPPLLLAKTLEAALIDAGYYQIPDSAAVFVVLGGNDNDEQNAAGYYIEELHNYIPSDLTLLQCQDGNEAVLEALSWLDRSECQPALVLAFDWLEAEPSALALVLAAKEPVQKSERAYAGICNFPSASFQSENFEDLDSVSAASISYLEVCQSSWLSDFLPAGKWQDLRSSSLERFDNWKRDYGKSRNSFDACSYVSSLAFELAALSPSLSAPLGIIISSLALHLRLIPGSSGLALKVEPCKHLIQAANTRPWIHPVSPLEETCKRRSLLLLESSTVLLNEAKSDVKSLTPRRLRKQPSELFLFEASSTKELTAALQELQGQLSSLTDQESTESLEISLWSGNYAFVELASKTNSSIARNLQSDSIKMAIVAANPSELSGYLEQAIKHLELDPETSLVPARNTACGIYYRAGLAECPGKLVFVLPGLGASYPHMLEELCFYFPEVREVFDYVELLALKSSDSTIPSRVIFPPQASGSALSSQAALATMDTAVVTLLLAEWAIFNLLKRLSVQADIFLGCSTGEFAAITMSEAVDILHASETFYKLSTLVSRSVTAEDLIRLKSIRVSAHYEGVLKSILEQTKGDLYLSADLSKSCVLISGKKEAVEELCLQLHKHKIEFLNLPVAIPYHTPLVSGKISPEDPEVKALKMAAPRQESWSCSTERRYPDDAGALRKISTELFEKPILLRTTIKKLYESGARIFVELGPRGGLCPYISETIQDISGADDCLVLASDLPNRSSIDQLNSLLAQLFCAGVQMNPGSLYERRVSSAAPPVSPPESMIADLFQIGSAIDPAFTELSIVAEQVMLGYMESLQEFHQSMMQTNERLMLAYLQAESESRALEEPPGQQSQEPCADDELRHAETLEQEALSFPFLYKARMEQFENKCLLDFELSTQSHPFLLDHAIGGACSSLRSESRVYLLPLLVALEIMAEGAALLLPDQMLSSIHDVRAFKRIKCASEPLPLRLVLESKADATVFAGLYSVENGQQDESELLLSAYFCFSPELNGSPLLSKFQKSQPRKSSFNGKSLYGSGAMFHGPKMQAVESIDLVCNRLIEGRLAAKPAAGWFCHIDSQKARFQIDPLLLDSASQFVLFQMYEHDIRATALLPFYIESIEFFAPFKERSLSESLGVSAYLRSMNQHGTAAQLEIYDADNQVLVKVSELNSRAIVLSPEFQNFVEDPSRFLSLSFNFECDGIAGSAVRVIDFAAIPDDDTVLDWLSEYILTESEVPIWRRMQKEKRRRDWLAGRIAAKEAVRVFLQENCGIVMKSADIDILNDESGLPFASLAQVEVPCIPSISISHCPSAAAALAEAPRQDRFAGIDIEVLQARDDGFEKMAFRAEDFVWLNQEQAQIQKKMNILWSVKEAAAKACGTGFAGSPKNFYFIAQRQASIIIESGIMPAPGLNLQQRCIFKIAPELNAVISLVVDLDS